VRRERLEGFAGGADTRKICRPSPPREQVLQGPDAFRALKAIAEQSFDGVFLKLKLGSHD
jgi:hypothetical protein